MMNKNTRILRIALYIAISFNLVSCYTTSNFYTGEYGDSTKPSNYTYALPQSVLVFDFEFVRKITYPGPYHEFADRYLGIKNVTDTIQTSWSINNIKWDVITEPDFENLYSINDAEGVLDKELVFNLTKYGLIVNPESHVKSESNNKLIDNDSPELLFTDLSVRRNIEYYEKRSTKKMLTDTGIVKISQSRKIIDSKTLKDKAEEAANFIIKTRKRRFKLLAGQYDFLPEGDALKTSVSELNKTEQEYLELFIGKDIIDTISYKIYFVPEENALEEHSTILYFSSKTGPAKTYLNKSLPIELHIYNKTQVSSIKRDEKSIENGVIYRMPGIAEIELRDNGTPLLTDRITIFQYGPKLTLKVPPVKRKIINGKLGK